jgi:hypothetical protein
MATFSINSGMGSGDITGSINYLLANIGQGLRLDIGTGIISLPLSNPATVYEYAFEYVQVAFADDIKGNGISFSPTNKSFYGVRNTPNLEESTVPNPASNYTWYEYNTFGTTVTLYYLVIGVGRILFIPGLIDPAPINLFPVVQNVGDFYNFIDLHKVTVSYSDQISVMSLNDYSGNPNEVFYPTISTYGQNTATIYNSLFVDTQYQYITSSTTASNYLSVPNIHINQTVNLQPLSAAPAVYSTGTIAVADRTGWDPAGIGSGLPYAAFYNGSTWIKLG